MHKSYLPKNVQIPMDLFLAIYHYFLGFLPNAESDYEAEELEEELRETIIDGIETKLNAIERRAAYSAYKDKNAAPEAREAARQAYLDLIGMFPSFRWEHDPNTFP